MPIRPGGNITIFFCLKHTLIVSGYIERRESFSSSLSDIASYARRALPVDIPDIKVSIDASLLKHSSINVSAPNERHEEIIRLWHTLIEGKIVHPSSTTTATTTTTATSATEDDSAAHTAHDSGHSSEATSAVKKTPSKSVVTRKSSFKKTMERAKDNWKSLIGAHRDKTDYEKMEHEKPENVSKLFEKTTTSTDTLNSPPKEFPEHDSQYLSVDVRTSAGEYENVRLQLTSPDKSVLSAHIAENGDGTFTIFCCPTIDDSFNMFVSLQGKTFKNDVRVLTLYGSFAGLREKERELACKTVNLIRWHLTPGLLRKEGEKLYPISTGLV